MARNNRIEGNVFVNDGDIELRFARSAGYTLSQNVVYATGQIVIHNVDAMETFDRNLFFSGAGWVEARQYQADSYRMIAIDSLPESEDALQADPLFVDLVNGDYRYQDDSPALQLGIAPIDVSGAGRTRSGDD
jgi:hypothetical protein